MCTYHTERRAIEGSGKGPNGWFSLSSATVYYDHPVHAMAEHTLNIDFANPAKGPGARVAVELTAESAIMLVDAISAALASAQEREIRWSVRSVGRRVPQWLL
ncbi:MAG: DUF6295 family protein [Nocardioidaceae bacterium]